ncbi:MAG: hypothetical protein JWN04_670, partial [Myxococcaceae bacterium]|nr:hypothetical protein [Myxococcaceae bacterium]
ESPVPIRDLPNEVKVNFIAGTLFAIGIMESWRDASECLQIADRLEQFSPLYAMSADHLRASYYASQGDLVRAEQLRRRIEVHAIQLGSTWLVETWAPAAATKLAWRANDPGMMKRAVQELGRLSAEIPSMVRDEQIARGAYLVLRHKYERAIAALETDLVPASFLGWAQARGMLARAYNELGKHDRAREICVDALSYLTAEDLTYVVYNMNLQVELALAEAGLEHFDVATRQLDGLLAQHIPKGGPLTLGALHQARARVALRQRDFAFARAELTQMEAQFRATNIATLIKLIEPLKQEIDRTENPRAPGLDGSARSREGARHTMTRVQLMLSQHSGDLVTERARRGLQVALELSSADEGFLVMHDADGQPIAQLGNAALSPELVAWAQQSMIDASFDEQTLMTSEVDSVVDSNFRAVGAMRYCVLPLWAHQQGEERVVAALVLGFENRVPRMPDATIMRAIAAHLLESSEEL